ncbi:hypothetical protein HK107_05010 [Parvularcula sp. ZS-1/3]|uniref:Flagellin n=1 Tax=Parvularcula mediterranea TaxID=2732508 RepID=A0A7Y3RKG2_9PROT|nr:hypothetical protein [Parvularcula mediterranea]
MGLGNISSVQTALRTLRAVQSAGEDVRAQISTGLKVRGANDNPAFFLVSQKTRSDVTVLSGLRENLTVVEGAIGAANAGIEELNRLVEQIYDLVPTAQTGIAIEEQDIVFGEILKQFRDTINASSFQGTNLLTQSDISTSVIGLDRSGSGFDFRTLSLAGGDFLRDSFFDGLEELDGEFVINAENFTSRETAIGRGDGLVNEWVAGTGALEGFMVWEEDGVDDFFADASPGSRTDLYRDPSDVLAYAPRIDYRVQVNTPGRYYVNVRGIGVAPAGDSIHVGFDGNVLTGTGGVQIPNGGGWGTRDTLSGARVFVDIAAPGIYTLNIWGREDGTAIDGIQFIEGDPSEPSAATPLPPPTPISGSDLPYFTDAEFGAERRASAGIYELLTLVNPSAIRLAPEDSMQIIEEVRSRLSIYQSQLGAYDRLIDRQDTYLRDLTGGLDLAVSALVEADLEEASSRLQAVQVQEQLALQNLGIINRSQSQILTLFN